MRKKSSHIAVKNTKDTILSIQFSLDGFSFCILDMLSKKTLYFSEYIFEETQTTPENLLIKIKEIFKNDAHLQHDFSSVLVIHQNNLATLVPNVFFNENNLDDYLSLNIKTLKTDFIAFDVFKNIEATNVYIPYININNYLFENFGEYEYKHHSTFFIDKLIEKNVSTEKTIFVTVFKNNFDMAIIEHKKLLFFNSFTFESKEDFIYHILFTTEQLQLDTEKCKLYFTGEINIETEIYKITYKYIRNIYFMESKNPIFNQLESPKHSHFIQLGS